MIGYANDFICDAGTVVIGRKGSINNPIFVNEPFWNVDTAFGLVANRQILIPKYLYYFCVNYDFEKLNTTVTIPSLTKVNLLQIDIDIPKLDWQKIVVENLDKITDLIEKRQAEIDLLDQLVKARFIESFGDPKLNEKHWEEAIISDLFTVKGGKRIPKGMSYSHSITNHPYLRATDMKNETIIDEDIHYIDEDVFNHIRRYTVRTGDIYLTTVGDDEGKLFTSGHFDLLICDEAHRSIYNKYKDIFTYFDAPLVGLTATPKDEIDKNTYEIFELENGVPTYGYDLAQAVKDGYLVDYVSVESRLKFIERGIVYDELSDEDKEAYEKTFEDEHGNLPEVIESSALNNWIFNEDTIKKVLNILMTDGIKIDYGQKLGKTIIFARNHDHAEKILEVFHKEYPHLPDYAKVIDNYMTYAQSAIDEFADPKKMPQIAISVDMLDTGIDVPEVLNLVFFKKVMSKAKFWQMIGRGTRLCPGLLNGEDKQRFYIFDFCGNFEFFRMNKGKTTANMIALQGAIFNLKFEISYKLQDIEYQTQRLIAYRQALVKQMSEKVQELPRDNFAVRQHLKYVDLYAAEVNYQGLTYEDTLIVREEVAPLILPDEDETSAVRFDALMYGIELAYLIGKKYTRARSDLHNKVAGIASVANIPEVQAQSELLHKILNTDYVDNAGINEFEEIREKLRGLMKYIPRDRVKYETNFSDELLSVEWKEAELENDDLNNYKAKAEYYIRQHQDNIAIAKLRTNQPLTETDMEILEAILWKEVGTKQDYEHEIGTKPLGEFVREIVGLDMNAAKEAFSEYLTSTSLDSRQIYFVNQIVEYIVHNGMMKDLSVLQESPFTDQGSVVELFTNLTVWMGIRKVIEVINANAAA